MKLCGLHCWLNLHCQIAQVIKLSKQINMKPGLKNCITDVSGIKVGHAQDMKLMSGTTVILPDEAAVAAVDCRGGAPVTLSTDFFQPEIIFEELHAIFLRVGI